MILSFRCKETRGIWEMTPSRRFPPEIQRAARRKMIQLDAATGLQDLRNPPGNRLEVLSGDRKGQHSIRVNDQFRLCFVWSGGNAENVELVDYH